MLKRCKSIKKAIQSIESAQEESLLLNNEKQIWTSKHFKFGLSHEYINCITSSTQLKHESYCDSELLWKKYALGLTNTKMAFRNPYLSLSCWSKEMAILNKIQSWWNFKYTVALFSRQIRVNVKKICLCLGATEREPANFSR